MTARAGLTVVGQVAGAFIGGPIGAAVGGAIGGMVGGAIDGPQRSTQALLDDLGALKFDYGSSWPRLYGVYRVKVTPIWSSKKRPVPHDEEVNSKGGPDQINRTFTYEQDWLCWAPLNATGWARIWINGKLRASRLSDADSETIEASAAQPAWADVTFFDGAADQLPWAVYEAAVGTANACAYRHRPTLAFSSLDLGNGGQPPLIEVEFASAGTSVVTGWTEDFESGLDAYVPHEHEKFGTAVSLWGNCLYHAGRIETGDSFGISRSIPPIIVDRVRFKFKVSTYRESGFRPDDATWIMLSDTGGTAFQFIPRREKFYDDAQRAYLVYPTTAFVSDEKLEDDEWYSGELAIDAEGNGTFALRVEASGALVKSISFTASPSQSADALTFQSDSSIAGGTLPSVWYDEIVIGEPADLVTPETVMLSEIVEAEETLAWSGEAGALTAADIDVTELASTPVRGFLTTSSPRESVAQLMDVFYFGVTCSDKLYHRLRGAASVATVPAADTGAGVGQAGEVFAGLERGNDLEQAIQVAVTGPNVLTDYEPGTEISDRLVGESVELRRYTTAVVLSPAERKGRADTMVLDGRVASHTGQVALDDRHAEKEPFDVWTQFDDEGNSYRVRADRETYADGVHTFDVVLDDATVLSTSGITAETDSRALTVRSADGTLWLLLDIPPLRDADATAPGFYVAARGAGSRWSGYSLYESADGVAFTSVLSASVAAAFGTCSTVLGAWAGGNVVDNRNTVTVTSSADLASYTDDQIIAGTAQAYLIGDEIVIARDATLVSAGVYKLSGLQRGLRGTEWAIAGHVSGERFARLDSALGRVVDEAPDLGVSRYWKGVTYGQRASDVASTTFADTGVSLKPFAPVDLEREVSASETVITWNRRSRKTGRFLATTQPALGEVSEAYDVELRDETDALVSTETVNEASWTGGGAIQTGTVAAPVWGIATIGGEMVAVRDEELGAFTTPKYLARFDNTGALLAQSPLLGYEIYQWCADGDELYAACATFTGGVPVAYLASTVKRLTRTSITSVAATYTAGTAGDVHGIAHDGSNVWISEYYGGNLRKLDETTLASVTTYALDVGITALQHFAGDLWVIASASDEVIQWNISGTAETQRFAVLPGPIDLLLDSGLVFVLSSGGLGVYDQTDGSLVGSHALLPPVDLAQRCMCRFGSFIAVADGGSSPRTVALFDKTTGAYVRRIRPDAPLLYSVAGEFDGRLYITASEPSSSAQTGAYELQADSLAGYSVTVYQLSATVGRGYPAVLEIPA